MKVLVFLLLPLSIWGYNIPVISSLSLKDKVFFKLYKDIRYNIGYYGRRTPDFKLRRFWFAKYRLKKGENFWLLVRKTSLLPDTIASFNHLPSPHALGEGDWVLLPNMRGVVSDKNGVHKIARFYNIPYRDVIRIGKDHFFIPGAMFSPEERGMFFGIFFKSPLKGVLTSRFGYRIDPFTHRLTFHRGIDIYAPLGTKVYPAMRGKVVFSGYLKGYGNTVIVSHKFNYKTLYAHLSRLLVSKGEEVSTYDPIGLVGSTGRSTGPHLHFEIRKGKNFLNPLKSFGFFSLRRGR